MPLFRSKLKLMGQSSVRNQRFRLLNLCFVNQQGYVYFCCLLQSYSPFNIVSHMHAMYITWPWFLRSDFRFLPFSMPSSLSMIDVQISDVMLTSVARTVGWDRYRSDDAGVIIMSGLGFTSLTALLNIDHDKVAWCLGVTWRSQAEQLSFLLSDDNDPLLGLNHGNCDTHWKDLLISRPTGWS